MSKTVKRLTAVFLSLAMSVGAALIGVPSPVNAAQQLNRNEIAIDNDKTSFRSGEEVSFGVTIGVSPGESLMGGTWTVSIPAEYVDVKGLVAGGVESATSFTNRKEGDNYVVTYKLKNISAGNVGNGVTIYAPFHFKTKMGYVPNDTSIPITSTV